MDYHYTDRASMEASIAKGEFIESAHVHTNLYGTSKEAVRSVIRGFQLCILDIDVQGVARCVSMSLCMSLSV